jgi:4-aminobutyrate aminotransferase-like enzyme
MAAGEDSPTLEWAARVGKGLPSLVTQSPGPRSLALHRRMHVRQHGAYTPIVAEHPVAFQRGEAVMLEDVDGNRYIDFSSGIVVTNLGHCHPRIAAAVGKAAGMIDNVHDFATPAKVEALELLATVTPNGMNTFAFFSSGSEAVEGAMRVARAATGRHGFVGFQGDFHGRTHAAAGMSTMQAFSGLRAPASFLVPNGHCYRCTFGLRYPACEIRCAQYVDEAIAHNCPGELAGVVVEPIANGAGAVVYQPEFLPVVRDVCNRHGGLLIVDEIASGFGRTGRWFACEHDGVVPDVMPIGKGLGNGFPVSAIAVRDELGDALAASLPSASCAGSAMACAAVIETIRVMQEEPIIEHCAELGRRALDLLFAMQERHPLIGEVRGRGALLALELVKDRSTREPFPEATTFVFREAFRRGVALATPLHVLRLTPPIVMPFGVLERGLAILDDVLTDAEAHFGLAA